MIGIPSLFALFAIAAPAAGEVVAIQAGTIYTVEDDRVIEGGGTVLIRDGRIVEVGDSVAIPPGARVVDYGPAAVIAPGFVAADSSYSGPGSGSASRRTAEPDLRAVDLFDPYSEYYSSLTGGVTSVYLAPARGRLIAGQGAVVKTGGDSDADRVLGDSVAIHGSISAEARSTPGYWDPPVPATVDVGMGLEVRQLPRSTMGAIVALEELLALADGQGGEELYGPDAGPGLRRLIDEGRSWRLGAETLGEVRALLDFFGERDLPLVLDGAGYAGDAAEAIAAAGVPVIVSPPRQSFADFGKSADSRWPSHDLASRLAAAGAKIAIATAPDASPGDLRFAASIARRGGLSAADALRAITLSPAEILGVAERVGSIAPGKDADLVVLSAPPLDSAASVIATWVAGEVAWKAHESSAVVVAVEELHVGDGQVITPGELLIEDGRITEVARRVARPQGAIVVRGFAAMPGMIDALGHLGLEQSKKKISMRFDLSRIVEPGDYADRRVAQAGVTTVVMGARQIDGKGSPTLAYKPAGTDFERMVVANPAAVRLSWTEKIRVASGDDVKGVLEKARKYKAKWEEYEREIAEWTPPAEEPDDEAEDGEEDEDEDEDEEEEEEDEEDDKPSKLATGVWEGEAAFADRDGAERFRFRLLEEDGALEGNLRCDGLSDDLVDLSGSRDGKAVSLRGLGSRGFIELELALKKDELEGTASFGGQTVEIEATRTSDEYVVARRPVRRRPEKVKPPKGQPKSPGIDPELEPLRQAMLGRGAVVVSVSREDEIVDCVDTFEHYGIRPVLFGADHAHKVADEIRGRVAGVLLSHQVTTSDSKTGTRQRNRYAELASAGIPVAFHSGAEEGAVELPLLAAYAVSRGMSPQGALSALTADAADMLAIDDRVGRLARGLDADVLLLDGSPLDISSSVLRVWVDGQEVR